MIKKIFSSTVFFSILMFLASCEDVVQIKLDEGSKLYVIDAFLSDLPGKQTVHVSTNDSYFSNRLAPPVDNANVKLHDLSERKVYSFSNAGNGDYTLVSDSARPFALSGHQYRLEVGIEGITYTSLVTQKRGAAIDSIVPYLPEELGSIGPPQKDTTYICTLFAKDKTDPNTDYYWIKTYRNDTLLFGPSQINLCIDGTGGAVPGAELDSLPFSPPAVYLGFNPFRIGNTCEAQIHSLSRETYQFLLQAQVQINNGGLFATTPENVKTNIVTPEGAKTRAVGWFNMATVARQKITVTR